MQQACECVTCEEAQPRGNTGMPNSLSSRSEASGTQQAGGRLFCERVGRLPNRGEHRSIQHLGRHDQHRVGDRVVPQVPSAVLITAMTCSEDLVVLEPEAHLAARVLFSVSNFETAEGFPARLTQP